MNRTTFTIEELDEAIEEVIAINNNFPELPIKFAFCGYNEFWNEDSNQFPITFKQIGKDKNVTIRLQEHYVGSGDGDNTMFCVIATGYGEHARYFKKTGYLDSWDNGNDDFNWDGGLTEVVSQEVKRTEWVAKNN